jgi:hypothetical protein
MGSVDSPDFLVRLDRLGLAGKQEETRNKNLRRMRQLFLRRYLQFSKVQLP